MSDITKGKALNKLNKITKKLGYPSKWKSYTDVYMNRWSYFDSMSSIFEYNFRKKIKDLNKLVDRMEWIFPPQTVNAFYVRFKNSFCTHRTRMSLIFRIHYLMK
jgi:putative endopeptidase